MPLSKSVLVLMIAAGLLHLREVRAQTAPPGGEIDACIGRLERAAATLRSETAALRQRSVPACGQAAAPGGNLQPGPPPAHPAGSQALALSAETAIRARLAPAESAQASCEPLDVSFEGTLVRVRGTASNRAALENATAEIRAFLPDVTIDLKDVDSLGCRKPIPGGNRVALADDSGELRRLTFDQAKTMGQVFPRAEECASVGAAVAPLLPGGASNRRFWVWSEERGDPVYCVEAGGSWVIRDFQLYDGRGAAIVNAR